MQFTMILFSLSDTFTTEPYSLVTYVLLLDRKKECIQEINGQAFHHYSEQKLIFNGFIFFF